MTHEPSGYAILNYIRYATVRSTDDGLAVGHGFQKYQAKSFALAGQSEHIAVGVTCEKFLLLQTMKKTGAICNAPFPGKLFEPGPVSAITNENQERV